MTLNKRVPPAAMLALALMGLHPGSQAGTITTQHASGCKPYIQQSGYEGQGPVFRSANGLWNYSFETRPVVCPVTRVGPPTSAGLRVWIDGYVAAGLQLDCHLVSINYDGEIVGGVSSSMTGTGTNFDWALELPPLYVPRYSSQAVYCFLPPGGGIYDIEPESLGS